MSPEDGSTSFDINASGDARVNAIGQVNAQEIHFGDRYEAQRQVLVTDIDPNPPVRNLATWVDRNQVQTKLIESLCNQQIRLVEVVALGGFGKSLLAVWAMEVEAVCSQFKQVLWINFQNVPSFNTFGRWIHQELGLIIDDPAITDESLIRQTIYRLGQKRCLVVMDQLEMLNGSDNKTAFKAFVSQWLQKGRHSILLTTTRNHFEIGASSEISGRSTSLDLPGFKESEGALFLNKQGVNTQLTEGLQQLSHFSKGHPLFLKLAASWVKETSTGCLDTPGLQFFERLFQQNLGSLESQVGEIFNRLLEQLMPMQRLALLEVSVYRTAFDLSKVQTMQPEMLEADVQQLEDKGFLIKQHDCWSLHPLIRKFVLEASQRENHEREAHLKAIDFFWPRVVNKSSMIDDHLECFHHLYAVGNYDTAYVVIQDCKEWLTLQGQYRLLIGIYQQLADVYQVPNSSNPESSQRLSVIFTGLSAAYWSLGEYRKSIDYQEQALTIYRELVDRKGEAKSLGNIGIAYDLLEEYRKAIDYQEQALAIKRELGYREGEAKSLGNIGVVYLYLGEYRKAIDYQEQALAIDRELGNRKGEADSIGNIGAVYLALREYRKAIDYKEQGLAIYRELGERKGEADSIENIGSVYCSLGEYRKAIDYQEQGLAIYREIDDRYGEASGLFNLAITCLKLAHHSRGREYFEQAKVIFTNLNLSHKAEKCDQAIRKCNRVIPAIPKMAPTIGIRTPHSIKSSWTKWLSCVLITILVIGIILLVQ